MRVIPPGNAPSMNVLGIDIGGSGIKGAPVDTKTGELTAERHRIPTPQPATPKAIAEVVAKLVDHFQWTGPVGITFPGVVVDGEIRTAANVDKSWIGVNANKLFGRNLDSVMVINDADAAGLAEMAFGAGKNNQGVVLVLTIGTGIGSALFVGGKLVPNTEFGHLELKGKEAESRASDAARDKRDMSWQKFAKRIGQYLRHMEMLFSPALMVIGGGISKKSDKYLPMVDLRTPVVPAMLLNEAGIVGAALAAEETMAPQPRTTTRRTTSRRTTTTAARPRVARATTGATRSAARRSAATTPNRGTSSRTGTTTARRTAASGTSRARTTGTSRTGTTRTGATRTTGTSRTGASRTTGTSRTAATRATGASRATGTARTGTTRATGASRTGTSGATTSRSTTGRSTTGRSANGTSSRTSRTPVARSTGTSRTSTGTSRTSTTRSNGTSTGRKNGTSTSSASGRSTSGRSTPAARTSRSSSSARTSTSRSNGTAATGSQSAARRTAGSAGGTTRRSATPKRASGSRRTRG